jgi:putative transposase
MAMGRLFPPFLFFLASCTENELRRQIEFLKAENEMLRKRVPKKRIFLTKTERERLIKLGKAIGSAVAKLITVVHPRTYQRWIQCRNAGTSVKRMGRPKTLESIREIVIRIAKETGWGYGRILGELKKLRIHAVSQSTIKNILKDAGMLPRPKKGQGTWDEFLKIHAETPWQVDFFSKLIWTPKGLWQCFMLAFIHVATRRVYCSPCSFQPNAKWMVRQAEVLLDHARMAGLRVDHVSRDRDGMYVTEFDAVLKNAGARVIPTAPHAPNQNVYIERWIRSIKYECLNHFIVFGQKHFDFLVTSYVDYYNTLRPHQGAGNRPLSNSWADADDPLEPGERIVCDLRLGGLLRHYERRAA